MDGHDHSARFTRREMIRMSPDAQSATDDVDNIVREVRTAAAEGVGCIVDGGHPDLGRDLEAVRRIAFETDVHIVACTGHYMERTYPVIIGRRDEDRIARGLASDAALSSFFGFARLPNLRERSSLSA